MTTHRTVVHCRELMLGDPAWDAPEVGAIGADDAGADGAVTSTDGAETAGRSAAGVGRAGAGTGDRGAFAVLQELRTHLERDAFERIHRDGAAQGLRFTGAFDTTGRCLGVAGWRILHTTSLGRKLYVDDLVTTSSARSRGVGVALLDHLGDIARAAGCVVIDLDSGQQRLDAHRFYRREGFDERSRHFTRPVDHG